MNTTDARIEPTMVGGGESPMDFSREEAAYERERARLVREHLGKIALIHGDDLVDVFATVGDAEREGCNRFGFGPFMLKEIRDPDLPVYMPLADPRDPSFHPDDSVGREADRSDARRPHSRGDESDFGKERSVLSTT